jgi:hypothetical protein
VLPARFKYWLSRKRKFAGKHGCFPETIHVKLVPQRLGVKTMRYRTLTAGLTAAALLYSPAPVFAQSAPPPAASHETGLQLADEDDDNHHRRRRGVMWIVAGFVTLLALYVLLHKTNDRELPTSP